MKDTLPPSVLLQDYKKALYKQENAKTNTYFHTVPRRKDRVLKATEADDNFNFWECHREKALSLSRNAMITVSVTEHGYKLRNVYLLTKDLSDDRANWVHRPEIRGLRYCTIEINKDGDWEIKGISQCLPEHRIREQS